jgi:carbamoyltransferase
MGFVVGVSAYFHESSISVFENGKLIFFSREEYFSRIKGDAGFPHRVLNHCIKVFGLTPNNVDAVAFYEKPLLNFLNICTYAVSHLPGAKDLLFNNFMKIRSSGLFFISDLRRLIEMPRHKIIFSPHHLSHCLSNYPYLKQIKDHAAIVVDGVGDRDTASVYNVQNGDAEVIYSQKYPHSVGLMYSAVTDYLGFNINEGEFKLMALAAYGTGEIDERFSEVVSSGTSGKLNLEAFDFYRSTVRSISNSFIDKFGPPGDKLSKFPSIGSKEFQRRAEIAHATQTLTERIVAGIFTDTHDDTGATRFTISGGVALNSKLIMHLSELPFVDELFVSPNPGDSGAAIGAGVFGSLWAGHTIECGASPYQGSTPFIKNQPDVRPSFLEELCDGEDAVIETARFLADGKIVAVVNGPIEVGPRALGHRSLICDPRSSSAIECLSQKLKKREEFRPLAPVVTKHEAENWFECPQNISEALRWMGCLVRAKEQCLREMPAICHVDGTARIQILDDPTEVLFKISEQFKEMTGVPVLVNTSFNCGGDPIVMDLQDTVLSMVRMGVEMVLIEKTLYRMKS